MKVFESYCWMSSTYTLVVDNREDNATLLYQGVGQGSGRGDSANLHHNYYQWVGLLLVLQAAASYAPWAAWKWAEGGRVGKLLAGVKSDPMTETAVEEQVRKGGASRLCLFDTQTFNTLIQSTMTLYTIYEATAKKLEFSSGKSRLATLF